MSLTAQQYRDLIDVQRRLVRRGVPPAVAGAAILRAVDRIAPSGLSSCGPACRCRGCGGLGRIQMRSLRRDVDPSIPPRQVIAGEQCVRIAETPGDETAMYQQLDDYRNRGWTVTEIEPSGGWPSGRVFWACPPGRVPMESQNRILAGQLGATTIPTAPVAIKDAPAGILADVAAAGDNPNVTAARDVVSKWSWLIPVGGLIMSAHSKVKSLVAGPATTVRGGRGR